MRLSRIAVIVLVLAAAAGGGWYWWMQQQDKLPEGIVSGNGRIETDQVDISAKAPGRIAKVFVREGDLVDAGQTVAQMDTAELEAQRAKARADVASAESQAVEARTLIVQRRAELKFAEQEFERAAKLKERGVVTQQTLDQRSSRLSTARAVLNASKARLNTTLRSADAAKALVSQIETQIADAKLASPVKGRVLYRLANTGEVVGAGGKVVTLLDLSQVYMEVFLPSNDAMRMAIGSDARIVVDGVDFAIPANVSFVSPEAQFTPKQVETRSEREKLMFRVKVKVPQELVLKHIEQVKTGVRGVAYLRPGSDNLPPWPPFLERRYTGEPETAGR